MKKTYLVLVFALALTLSSCGGCSSDKATQGVASDSTKLSAVELDYVTFSQKVFNDSSAMFLGSKPAIIDFYATWCGPCRQLAPILDELLNQYEGKFDLYKVDVDVQQRLAIDFGVESLPTLLLIPLNGEPKFVIGLQSKGALEGMIKDVLKVE